MTALLKNAQHTMNLERVHILRLQYIKVLDNKMFSGKEEVTEVYCYCKVILQNTVEPQTSAASHVEEIGPRPKNSRNFCSEG